MNRTNFQFNDGGRKEAGFKGTSWLSETILIPLIVFQVISALKNAEQAGFIKNDALAAILNKIDRHKSE